MYNIVIIEDSEIAMGLLSHVVEEVKGVKVHPFTNGLDAINFFKLGHGKDINLVLCDWELPDTDGYHVLEVFRKEHNTTPFFMVTAHSSPRIVKQSQRSGATGYIAKPYVAAKVIEIIEKLKHAYESKFKR